MARDLGVGKSHARPLLTDVVLESRAGRQFIGQTVIWEALDLVGGGLRKLCFGLWCSQDQYH